MYGKSDEHIPVDHQLETLYVGLCLRFVAICHAGTEPGHKLLSYEHLGSHYSRPW